MIQYSAIFKTRPSIPYPVARQNGTNNVKITATTGDTTATYKESFTH